MNRQQLADRRSEATEYAVKHGVLAAAQKFEMLPTYLSSFSGLPIKGANADGTKLPPIQAPVLVQ